MRNIDAVRTTVDYDAIVQTLKEGMMKAKQSPLTQSLPEEIHLKEFCTIGFTSTRQTGKTAWIKKKLEEDPKTIAIVLNQNFRNFYAVNHRLSEEVQSRIFTVVELRKTFTDAHLTKLPEFNTIIFDDALYIFERVERAKVYHWLTLSANKDPLIILVS